MAEVLAMHRLLLDEFGGLDGLRDMGALDAALMRPQLGYYDTLTEQAAALMESLAMNHPFIDGNKRVAFFITDIFLRMNGAAIECDNEAAYHDFIEMFENQRFRFEVLKRWIESHLTEDR